MTNDKFPIKIPVKGSIESLIKGRFDGIERFYLVNDSTKKGNLLIIIIDKLQKKIPKDTVIIYEAKYSMGFRNKRIDIAIWNQKSLLLCKLVNKSSGIDKGAVYLDTIITHIKSHLGIDNIVGCIICRNSPAKTTLMHIRKILTNKFIFVQSEDILKSVSLNSLPEISTN